MVFRYRMSLGSSRRLLRAVLAAVVVALAGGAPAHAAAAPAKANQPKLGKPSAVRTGAVVELRWQKTRSGHVEIKLKQRTKRVAARAGKTTLKLKDLRSAAALNARACRSGRPARCGRWQRIQVRSGSGRPDPDFVDHNVVWPGATPPAPTTPANDGVAPVPGSPDQPAGQTPKPNPLDPKAAPAMETDAVWPPPVRPLSASACAGRLIGSHATYDVGPGRAHEDLQTVPWLSLQAGDVVNIHARFNADGTPKPYRTKVGLRSKGTAAKPIYVNGVTDGDCRRPIIDGDGATTADDAAKAHFGSYGIGGNGVRDYGAQSLGLFLLWALGDEAVHDAKGRWTPSYITIQNLELRNARSTKTFENSGGGTTAWSHGASAIYAVRANHLTVENCVIEGNDQGVFTNTRGYTEDDHSDVTILRRNTFTGNGTGQSTEHNAYIQSRRALYEGNFFGQVWGGSSLKDRGSGTVVRFNHILSSARAIDLVDTEEENHAYIADDPLYDWAWVYGNVIRTDINLPLSNTGNTLAARPIHFGHDKDAARSRGEALFFYGNTYLHRAKWPGYYWTTLFQVGGNDDDVPFASARAEASGNVIWSDDGTVIWRFSASQKDGRVVLRGTNYRPFNWYDDEQTATVQRARRNPDHSFQLGPDGQPIWDATTTPLVETAGSTQLVGDSLPGHLAPKLDLTTLRPLAGSPAIDRGLVGPSSTPPGVTAANLSTDWQLTYPVGIEPRPVRGAALDLGALESTG